MHLPCLVGGAPSTFDLKPTIVFLSLYALLLPFCLVAVISPRRRNVLQLPITAQIIERIINLSLRLFQTRRGLGWGTREEDIGLLEYQMIALGWGWIALAQAMGPLLRSIMVNSTRPSTPDESDEKILRQRIRRFWWVMDALFWLANLLGMASGLTWRIYIEREIPNTQQETAVPLNLVNPLRYSSTGLGITLTLCSAAVAQWTRSTMRGVNRRPCNLLIGGWLVLLVIPVYRLSVFTKASTLFQPQSAFADGYQGATSLSSNSSKILFYIFHMAPEFVVSALLITIDTRNTFSTGIWGDQAFSWREGWRSQRQKFIKVGDACLRKVDELIHIEAGKKWKSDTPIAPFNPAAKDPTNILHKSPHQGRCEQGSPVYVDLSASRSGFLVRPLEAVVPRLNFASIPTRIGHRPFTVLEQTHGAMLPSGMAQPPLHYHESSQQFSWWRGQ